MMLRTRKLTICLLLIIAFISFGTSVYAGGENDKTLSPYFFIDGGDPSVDNFPLKSTNVVVNISGVIADVTVIQRYTNNGTRPINARYIFPASTRAAVHGMVMKIGEKVIVAKIKERQTARKEFNQAKKQGKSASLLKQQRPNVFSMNVANIMPEDTIDIELHYTELLIPTDGTYEFVYPTVVGPRYSSQLETEAPEMDQWVNNPYLKEDMELGTKFQIGVYISTGLTLQEVVCPSHETDIIWPTQSIAQILLNESEKFGGNRDFILKYRLAGQKIEAGLMLYAGEDENFFLLMVQPPERVAVEEIPPREYIFVVDVSGSMHGFPLNTAKKLLQNLISGLRPTDKFNVILFAGVSQLLAPESLPATQKNIRRAIRVIDRQQGGGGTELYRALKKSLFLPRDEKYSRTVLIVTDGYISAEKKVFHLIQKNLYRTNFFSFGIGSGVNRYLIEGMAKAGLGEPFVVTKPQEARRMADKFQEYVQTPVLTHVAVKYNGFETFDIEPPAIPDLFARRPVIVFGKWRGKLKGTIELLGEGGQGQYIRTFRVADTTPNQMNHVLRYLWARTRIGRLADFSAKKDNSENKAQITSLGLTYNLLTAYTSFIAVNEVVRNPGGDNRDVKQPLPLPKGVSNLAVGGSYSQVPEPEMYVMLAILAIILALIFCYRTFAQTHKGSKGHHHVRGIYE